MSTNNGELVHGFIRWKATSSTLGKQNSIFLQLNSMRWNFVLFHHKIPILIHHSSSGQSQDCLCIVFVPQSDGRISHDWTIIMMPMNRKFWSGRLKVANRYMRKTNQKKETRSIYQQYNSLRQWFNRIFKTVLASTWMLLEWKSSSLIRLV